jgi:hypothetical protein
VGNKSPPPPFARKEKRVQFAGAFALGTGVENSDEPE